MKLAYVLNTYPLPSHSFIRRELAALEADGDPVLRLAMRRPDVPLPDAGDQAEQARTEYVLDRGAVRLAAGAARLALGRPARFFSALRLALSAGRAAPGGRLRHLIYLAEAARVAQRCAEAGITHVHAHFGTNSTAVAMLCHALGGPRYSFTAHGPEEFDAPAAFSLGTKLDRAAFAVGVSQFGRSQLCRWAAFETWPRIKVVHCGIEPAKFATPAPLPEGPLRLVSIGRFVEQKGQMVLVEAMARLRDTNSDVHLTLVGDGPMRGDLEAAIARHDLGGAITLTGWLDEDGVRAALDAAHALAMPSFAEGLPMVVMEAMAAERAVIATYIAGTPELVRPGETGSLVPAGDAAALADAIRALAVTPRDRLQDMARAGRARVLQRHDVTAQARKLASYFADPT
ncbi:glycosyltransferase family 4 protein [Seohaeicola saemankumensis]|nr:glycosyltransferase family 4 protein [Seohaeicola saemankumensis]MCA0869491.1 glycosyltransferase family 4 protein [Seohaeicola saemankumensis]